MNAQSQPSDYDRGVAAFDQRNYPEAATLLERAAHAQPENAQAWKALGVVYTALEQYGRAEVPFRRACELGPRLPDACYFYGRTLYVLNRFDESLRVFERAPVSSWRIPLSAGQAQEALGKPEDAERNFRQALALCRNADPRPGLALGLFLVRQGRFPEAAPPIEDVLKQFPENGEGHLLLGRAMLEQGRVDEALPWLERGVSLLGSSAQAHFLLAKALSRLGRTGDAQAHFEAASKLEARQQGSR